MSRRIDQHHTLMRPHHVAAPQVPVDPRGPIAVIEVTRQTPIDDRVDQPPRRGAQPPFQLAEGTYSKRAVFLPSACVCALIAVAIVAVLGYRQIDVSVKVLSVLVAAKFLVVLKSRRRDRRQGGRFGTSGLSLEPLTPHALVLRSLPIALLFCFASFVGLEATAIYSEEAKDPKRTVPRATFLAVIVIGVVHVP